MADVTQADRDAAAEFAKVASGAKDSEPRIRECRQGKQDDTITVQAFAAHRMAAERAVVEWLRKEADDLIAEKKTTDHWTPEWLSLREQIEDYQTIADRVEAGEHLTPR